MSFFRYPGGKTKLKQQVLAHLHTIPQPATVEYREPFFGGGSIGLEMMKSLHPANRVWVNDFDPGIAALWTTLIQRPELLKAHVSAFTPTIAAFDVFKAELLAAAPTLTTDEDRALYGFKKLAIHQISYSGLGTKSGGPLGGREQASAYKIDCRWSPKSICKKIDTLHRQFAKFNVARCSNTDFAEVIADQTIPALIYLDPPYFVKGNDLYQHGFTEQDHIRLAAALQATPHTWVLSYDDCPEVRELYRWAHVYAIGGVNYSITTSRQKVELLITPVPVEPRSSIFTGVLEFV